MVIVTSFPASFFGPIIANSTPLYVRMSPSEVLLTSAPTKESREVAVSSTLVKLLAFLNVSLVPLGRNYVVGRILFQAVASWVLKMNPL